MIGSRAAATFWLGLCMTVAAGPSEARGKPISPPPPPATPPARAWHGFASNGAALPAESRLQLYGGNGSNLQALKDHWYYTAQTGNWTYVTPAGTQRPGPRQWMGWTCGQGSCVLVNGSNGVSLVSETWVFSEAAASWSAVNCRKGPCPSARQMVTAAFDASSNRHVLFGGLDPSQTSRNDTWTFNAATMKWQSFGTQPGWPSARNRAAAANVPGLGVVMLGGQVDGNQVFCDAYVWQPNAWTSLSAGGAPCLHSHSMAWDASSSRLIVTGGYVDTSDTPNATMYYLQFKDGTLASSWARDDDTSGCYAAVRPGARMAIDAPTAAKVFFGGDDNAASGAVRYGDTTTCP